MDDIILLDENGNVIFQDDDENKNENGDGGNDVANPPGQPIGGDDPEDENDPEDGDGDGEGGNGDGDGDDGPIPVDPFFFEEILNEDVLFEGKEKINRNFQKLLQGPIPDGNGGVYVVNECYEVIDPSLYQEGDIIISLCDGKMYRIVDGKLVEIGDAEQIKEIEGIIGDIEDMIDGYKHIWDRAAAITEDLHFPAEFIQGKLLREQLEEEVEQLLLNAAGVVDIIESNQSVWDRAIAITAEGKFLTSLLDGHIELLQLSQAVQDDIELIHTTRAILSQNPDDPEQFSAIKQAYDGLLFLARRSWSYTITVP